MNWSRIARWQFNISEPDWDNLSTLEMMLKRDRARNLVAAMCLIAGVGVLVVAALVFAVVTRP